MLLLVLDVSFVITNDGEVMIEVKGGSKKWRERGYGTY
jgi:hypothetical protein